MFELYAEKNKLTRRTREPLTSGSVNVYTVRFEFSADWDGLERVAVFKAGTETQNVLLDASGQCTIPWEVLTSHGRQLTAGVYGTKGGEIVLPTIWADLGKILEGVPAPQGSVPPTPELWEQELNRKGDRMDYTNDGDLGLYAGDKLLSAVPIQGGGGEGGTSDHRALTHRDAAGQHPIAAIDGLADELNRIPQPVEALTNSELEELLK